MSAALILIDIQKGFNAPIWGKRNNLDAETNAAKLLAHWRANGWPIFHIRHVSVEPNSPLSGSGTAFKPEVEPLADEVILEKSVNSAFIGTDLEIRLRESKIPNLVICGLTTPHCVSTTTRMAANLGFTVKLVADACASFTSNADMSWKPDASALDAQTIHDTALAHLHGEFATVVQSTELLA